jgi:hypothetical protein
VLGLALRVPTEDGYGDVLLATTGTGFLTRYLLRPTRNPAAAVYTSLFPYQTPSGPLLLAAFPTADRPTHFELAWSRLTGQWLPFAELDLTHSNEDDHDARIDFDPVLHVIPALEPYGWARRLREPSYAAARHARTVFKGVR